MRLDQAISSLDTFIFTNYRVVHSVRVALAFMLTMLLTGYFDVPERTWILITLVVVIVPMSYLGNVLPRAWHRVLGTIIGAGSGVLAIAISQYSFIATLIWCGAVIYISAYYSQGKRPYVCILVCITLSVTAGGGDSDVSVALWRAFDVSIGCAIAVAFCLIYPQRAFIHWRMRIHRVLSNFSTVYHLSYSPNVIEKPDLEPFQKSLVKEMAKINTLGTPSIKETRLNGQIIDAIQNQLRNMLCTIELLNHSYWSDRESHLNMLYSKKLKLCQKQVEKKLMDMAHMVTTGELIDDGETLNSKEIIQELKSIIADIDGHETDIYGYIWLNVKLIEDLASLKRLLILALNLSHTSKSA
ncbi:FUSC family protein [Vibrio gallicus]|uniref:FUSC family protein n=1 Tax=Vibrio gallicus TaxID=190897 RepID=UPI0021C34B63|nr:FUSC family protein [Vibrio gallicus]